MGGVEVGETSRDFGSREGKVLVLWDKHGTVKGGREAHEFEVRVLRTIKGNGVVGVESHLPVVGVWIMDHGLRDWD